jgi:hypothetical protein
MNATHAALLALSAALGYGPEGRDVEQSGDDKSQSARVGPKTQRDLLFQQLLADVDRWEAVYTQQPRNRSALRREAESVGRRVQELFPRPAHPAQTGACKSKSAPDEIGRAQGEMEIHHKYAGPGSARYADKRLAQLPPAVVKRNVKAIEGALAALSAHWSGRAPASPPASAQVKHDFADLRRELETLAAPAAAPQPQTPAEPKAGGPTT